MRILFFLLLFSVSVLYSQDLVENIDLDKLPSREVSKLWLKIIDDGQSRPISIPVIIAKGTEEGPVLGLTAAIHGNELNGIKVIQEVIETIDVSKLKGTILAIPGLNQVSIIQDRRRFYDHQDLNRIFPGKENGTRSQQYVWHFNKKVLPHLDYLIDMHTASFGRINSLYVRGDLSNSDIKAMALLQDADIVLKSKGPSAGVATSSTRTLRAEASLQGIPTITVEYGNPQVFQPEMIKRGVDGVKNVMSWLKMHDEAKQNFDKAILCERSYWIYVDKGGVLEVPVELKQIVEKGEVIGVLRNPFGDVLKTYTAPERGIVIGKSTNPINMSGGRIIHLGILAKD